MEEGLKVDFGGASSPCCIPVDALLTELDSAGSGSIDFEGLCTDTLGDFKSMGMTLQKMLEIMDAVHGCTQQRRPHWWPQVIDGLKYQDEGGQEVGEAHQVIDEAAEEAAPQ